MSTPIHAFREDGTPSPGAQLALDRVMEHADEAVAAIPTATLDRNGLMSARDQTILAAPGVYASDYGAVGDGVADDSAALTAAAAAAEGTVLHLTAGATYSIPSKVTLSDGITVEGHGARLVKPADASDSLAFVKGTPVGVKGYGSGGHGITIRDLTIVGSYAAPEGHGDATSWFHHVSGLVIERCQFQRGMIDGHYIDLAACTDVTVRDCVFEGANPKAGREYIEAIQVDSSTYAGSSDKSEPTSTYDGLPTRGVTVTRCDFRTLTVGVKTYATPPPIGMHSNALVTDDGYYRDVAFTDNTVTGWAPVSSDFWAGWVMLSGLRGGIIARNRFTYTGAANVNQRGVIALRRATSATPIDQVEAASPTSVTIDRPCHTVTITDNTFTGFDRYWTTSPGWGLIGVYGSGAPTGIAISGNRVGGCNGEAISINGGTLAPVVVSGNTITATDGIRAQQTNVLAYGNAVNAGAGAAIGIGTSGEAAPVELHSNMIAGFPRGIVVDGADNGLIQGNFVDWYTVVGIQIGQATGNRLWDMTVSGNRCRAPGRTPETLSLSIGATATRTRRFGNQLRDGGPVSDLGSGTISSATDQTA